VEEWLVEQAEAEVPVEQVAAPQALAAGLPVLVAALPLALAAAHHQVPEADQPFKPMAAPVEIVLPIPVAATPPATALWLSRSAD
jgi:hypothetical protein